MSGLAQLDQGWPQVRRRVEALDETVRDLAGGGASVGVQLHVTVAGEQVLDCASGTDGRGQPTRLDTLFAVYCATKPLVGLVAAVLVERGQLDYDRPLGSYLTDATGVLGDTPLRDLVAHRAGLHRLSAVEANLVPAERWRSTVLGTPPPGAFRIGVDQAYAEFSSWFLLGEVINAAAGRSWQELVTEWIIEPCGAAGEVFLPIPPSAFAELAPRLGVTVDLRAETGRPIPILIERTPRAASRPNAAFGGYASARGLGRIAAAVLSVLRGEMRGPLNHAVVARSIRPVYGRGYDFVTSRSSTYGHGWMLDLSRHGIAQGCSESSFGHTGHTGMRLMLVDPAAELTVGLVVSAAVDPDAGTRIRGGILDAVYADLARLR